MRRILAIALGSLLALQPGCGAARHGTRSRGPASVSQKPGHACGKNRAAQFPRSNLVFGAAAGDLGLAQALADRSTWPSLDDGYVVQDESSQTELIWDNQVFFDSFGGTYWRNNLVTSTRVRVR